MNIPSDQAQDLLDLATATAVTILGNEVGADYGDWATDIASDTMVKILEHEGEVENLFTFCKTTAQHLAIDFLRTELRRREIEDEYGESINRTLTGQSAELLAADPYEILAYEEMRGRLDQLSPLLYSTVDRHYMNGLSIAEIAAADDVTEAVIRKRLQRAREYIRDDAEEDVRQESTRPSMEDIEQHQRDNFKRRDEGYVMRKIRRENPDATLAEWTEAYGQAN